MAIRREPHLVATIEPLDALVDVANHLSARGIALYEGSYVTTGSATETVPVIGGRRRSPTLAG